jgi:hypothetical protein
MAQGRTTADIIWSAVISLIAIVLLHQPWLSLQKLLGTKVFTFPEMAGMKLLVGFLTSLVVVGLCVLLLRRLSLPLVLAAAAVQIVWIEFEWGFSVRAADAGELIVRFAEELGVVASGVVVVLYVLTIASVRERKTPS